jgi:RecJ-like exonuclease
MEARTVSIANIVHRERCRISGYVRSVRVRPGPSVPVFEIVLQDATGRLVGAFWGRRSIPGIEPGRRMELEGTPRDRDGEMVMANPLYTLLPATPGGEAR